MSPAVEFQLDQVVNALYIKLGPGVVAGTITVTDMVYVDVDDEGTPIGIEFTNADEVVPFLRAHSDDAELPPKIRGLFRLTGV